MEPRKELERDLPLATSEGAAEELLSLADLEALYGLKEPRVRRLVRDRRLASIRDGHWLRFRPGDVEAFFERARVGAEEAS